MAYLIYRQDVEDYARWKPIYDTDARNRKNYGCRGAQLLQNSANPNEVIVVMEWDNLDQAQKFAQSPELSESMQNAGVVGRPDIYFLNEVERTPA